MHQAGRGLAKGGESDAYFRRSNAQGSSASVHVSIQIACVTVVPLQSACTRPGQPQSAISHHLTCLGVYFIVSAVIRPGFGNWLGEMISDASKLALVGVAAVFGILAGFKVSNNMATTLESKPHIEAIKTEQRLLREEEAANKLNSDSASGQVNVGKEPPMWQLAISQVTLLSSLLPGCLAACYYFSQALALQQANAIHFIHIRNAFKTLGWIENNATRYAETCLPESVCCTHLIHSLLELGATKKPNTHAFLLCLDLSINIWVALHGCCLDTTYAGVHCS